MLFRSALPAELVPPFATGDVATSGIGTVARGTGLESSRRIAFRWGSKTEGEKNLVKCLGQRVPAAIEPAKGAVYRYMHILAAATKEAVTAGFTLQFDDRSEQYTSFQIGRWDGGAANDEEVAFAAGYIRTASGAVADRPASLYRYTIKIAEKKKLATIVLPNVPDVRIVAITLEK